MTEQRPAYDTGEVPKPGSDWVRVERGVLVDLLGGSRIYRVENGWEDLYRRYDLPEGVRDDMHDDRMAAIERIEWEIEQGSRDTISAADWAGEDAK